MTEKVKVGFSQAEVLALHRLLHLTPDKMLAAYPDSKVDIELIHSKVHECLDVFKKQARIAKSIQALQEGCVTGWKTVGEYEL